MTENEKAKAYDEALERAKAINNEKDVDVESGTTICEYIFPELKESEDEKIKKEIISILRNTYWTSNRNRFNELVAWFEKQDEQKPCMVQWKGDNLKEVISLTGKDKNFEKWFKSFEEYEKYVHEHNDIFKLFDENGNHYEIPVGAWIVKTPDGYNIASNAVLKQKSVDKIKPEFKVGDWVVRGNTIAQILDIQEQYYIGLDINGKDFVSSRFLSGNKIHLWTIQDAKNGDVLIDKSHIGECVFIFKEARASDIKTDVNNPLAIIGYCGINHIGFTSRLSGLGFGDTVNCIYYPATKEQRDTLMKAMNNAGYKWDAEKKELKKLVPNRFDPKTLKPFDNVLVRDSYYDSWKCMLFSHIIKHERFPYICVGHAFAYCIPHNEDTKHLVGTTEEAPEYYRYWED